MHRILRATLALALVTLGFATGPATAQPQPAPQTDVTQVQLGVREAGKTYPLALDAANADCNQPLDFRFTSNAAWLKLPADPVVRGVPTGQSRPLQATIDLTTMSPGRYQATVEVECENCGWFVFKSCKIDKQQIVFVLDVAPAGAQPQPPANRTQGTPGQGSSGQGSAGSRGNETQQSGPGRSGQSDLGLTLESDPRVPKEFRDRLNAAGKALNDAKKRKRDCEDELAAAQAKAAAAKAAADKAAQAAADTAANAKKAADAAKKAEAKADAADKEEKAAADHAKETERVQGRNARDTADAKAAAAAAAAAAEKARADARDAKAAAKAAAAAVGEAEKAAKQAASDAKDAAGAADRKQKECVAAADDEAKAQAAATEAEKAAKDSIPPAARRLTPEEELAQLKKAAEDCWRECLAMARAQRIALEELTKVGLIHDQAALDNWAAEYNEIIDGVGDILGEIGVPGTDYGAVLAKGALVAVAAGSKLAGAKEMQIRLTDPKATQDWLQGKGGGTPKVASPAEAKAVQQEMNRAMSGGLGKMTEDLAKKKAECEAAEKKYEEAKAKAGAK